MSRSSNPLAGRLQQMPDEFFMILLDAGSVRIERIISYGHASPDGFGDDQDQYE